MSAERRFAVWRNQIVELLVPLGHGRAYGHPARTAFRAELGLTHFGFPLTYDDFTTGASDYDTASDEIYCPCGETLCWDGDAGDLLRRIDAHCLAKRYPLPKRSDEL